MSRDPFDELRDGNPVSADDLPSPPMALADRIIGRQARRQQRPFPGWAIAATAAAVVLVAGGSLLWLTRPLPDPVGVADGGETTTLAPPPTIAPPTTTQAPGVVEPTEDEGLVAVETSVFLFADRVGDGWPGGPFLIPVAVTVETRDAPASARAAGAAQQALLRLFEGIPESAGDAPGLSTAIPTDAEFHGLELDEGTGIVTVFVSAEFASGGGSYSMLGRLAQVVYTATAVDGVAGVRFEVDGEPTTVFGGEGVIVDDPATRDGFDTVLPAIMIETPPYGGTATNPLVASGTANVFEATVQVGLTDSDGRILWEGFTTASDSVFRRGDWTMTIPYEVDTAQWGRLVVWEESAEDGRLENLREHRVWLVPAGTSCSGQRWETPLLELEGLPAAVAETRRAIWEAATTCDWAALERLIPDEFSFSFAFRGGRLAVAEWQDLEAQGGMPMYYLVELLTRPYRRLEFDAGTYYVWPSAFAYPDWASVPTADREALRPLYGDREFDGFADFGGYVGYRIGIADDGTWRYFIAGD
jgi:hypothetical protein